MTLSSWVPKISKHRDTIDTLENQKSFPGQHYGFSPWWTLPYAKLISFPHSNLLLLPFAVNLWEESGSTCLFLHYSIQILIILPFSRIKKPCAPQNLHVHVLQPFQRLSTRLLPLLWFVSILSERMQNWAHIWTMSTHVASRQPSRRE